MLLGSRDRRRADRAGAARHRPDRPQLRHRPGRDERAPALPVPARPHRRCPACPTPACRCSASDGAHYPLTPERARRRARPLHPGVRPRPGRRLLRHDAGAPAPGRRAGRRPRARRARRRAPEPGVASLYQHVPFRQDTVVPVDRRAHQRQRLARRSARRCSRSAGTTASRSPATRSATARTCSTCASTTSAATASTTCSEIAGRFATASTLPIVLDSTEPAVIEAGLEMLGGRAVVNSVNYEDGDGPESRFARVMPIVQRARRRRGRADHRRGGPGPHRRVEGARSPSGSSTTSPATGACGSRTSSSTA